MGSVVLFQLYDSRSRKILFEIEDILNVCPSPSIYGLIVISHNEYVPVLFGDDPYELILNPVRVLIFVHKHISEAFLVMLS